MAKERINFFELSEEKPSLLLTYRLFTLDDLEMAIVEKLAIVKGFAGTIVPQNHRGDFTRGTLATMLGQKKAGRDVSREPLRER